ncbi:MAG: hypothetical protein QM723_02830 [Myxococcaceae bacterium]
MRSTLFAVSAVVVVACSSSSPNTGGGGGSGGGSATGGGTSAGGGTGGGGQDVIADPCNVICTKLDMCDPSDGGVAACTPSCQQLVAPFRTDFTQALARCNRDTACADLFHTTSSCNDAGTSCSTNTENTCFTTAGSAVSDSVLDGFFDGGVCAHLVTCGTVADDSACHTAITGLHDFEALKAYPDSAITCTSNCMATAMCNTLGSAMLGSALDDCASKTCGIHLSK